MQEHHTTRTIPLTKGYEATVDAADYEWLSQWRWFAQVNTYGVYAFRTYRDGNKRRKVYMHREIMRAERGIEVDHIDRDGLNNQRSNLRLATRSQNTINTKLKATNTSGYRGVCRVPNNKYVASIKVGEKRVHLGLFSDPIEAARAYDAAAIKHHGEFAQTNFQGD